MDATQTKNRSNEPWEQRGVTMDGTGIIVWGLIFSSIGIGYFIYGRRQDQLVAKYCGIALMVFPYFTPDVYWLLGIGAGLMALTYFLNN